MIVPVILCGGSGTRLWPLSRSNMPKQLQAIQAGKTMLQSTILRLSEFAANDVGAPVIVCNGSHRFVTRRQLQEVGINNTSIIAEPVGRNTAPALTLAALSARDRDPSIDPVLVVMPADHCIANLEKFQQALTAALRAATAVAENKECIVTFGIVPTEPATGYGYLRFGKQSAFDSAAFVLDGFIEKPTQIRAQQLIDSGNVLWNSGLFVVRASVWLKVIAALEPVMLEVCTACLTSADLSRNDQLLNADLFAKCPSISIDYAVMEKLSSHAELNVDGAVVPLDAGWSDIGTWDSAWAVSAKDENGNVSVGEAIFEKTHNTYVHTSGPNAPLIACLGVDDAIVVQTPDAILVANKRYAQDVKNITAQLAERRDVRADLHRKVHRPWGTYDSLGSGPDGAGFQVKHIAVYPGQSLSLQLHHRRAEHWVVIKGCATITVGESIRDYSPGDHVFIEVGTVHRLENRTETPVEIIEVQLGAYLGEDDIVRIEDVYQRV